MIFINNLYANYGTTEVLKNFSLKLEEGESYALIGPSGCGKSTLMKILCGVHKDFRGDILYDDASFFKKKISLGYVPQNYGLLDWKTVESNIFLPIVLDEKKKHNKIDVNEIIKTLEIDHLLKKYPLELSGGQRQRVALARAFVCHPDLLLMDEAFSSLDSFTSARSQKLYLKLRQKHNITTLFITHNILEAVSICKHILLMDKKSGCIIKQIDNLAFDSNNHSDQIKMVTTIMDLFEASEK